MNDDKTNFIDKARLLVWIDSEKARIIEGLKGKDLKSNPRKQEYVKSLDSVIKIIDQFQAVQDEMVEGLKPYMLGKMKSYYDAKRHIYYDEGPGKQAIEMATEFRKQGMSWADTAYELELAGIKTVNGRTKWSPMQLYRIMKARGVE